LRICVYMRLYASICVYMRLYASICVYMRLYASICVYMRLYAAGAVPPFPVLRLINKSAYVTRCVAPSAPSRHARTKDGRAPHARARARMHAAVGLNGGSQGDAQRI